jgi:hypothetical protein
MCTISEESRAAAEEAIYRWLLFELDGNTSLIVLEQRRNPYTGDQLTAHSWPWVSESIPSLPGDVFADYLSANEAPPDLPTDLQLVTPYYLIHTDEQGGPEMGWSAFHTRFRSASGYWVVSRVGLNCAEDRALIYVGKGLFGGANAGWWARLYLLTLSNGEWHISDWTFVSQS